MLVAPTPNACHEHNRNYHRLSISTIGCSGGRRIGRYYNKGRGESTSRRSGAKPHFPFCTVCMVALSASGVTNILTGLSLDLQLPFTTGGIEYSNGVIWRNGNW